MADLPPELGPAGGPDAFGQASSESRFAPRNITMEDAIARQLDRIAFLRSTGQEWAEAVYQLRDMVVGLEDDEFWDGIPNSERSKIKKLPEKEREKEFKRWAVEGWNGYPVRAFRGPGGQPIYVPTSENLSCALRIVMRLLARQGIAWRTRRISKLEPWGKEKEPEDIDQTVVADEDGVETGSAEVVVDEDSP